MEAKEAEITWDIAFEAGRQEVIKGLDKIIKNSPDLKSFEHEVIDYVEGFRQEMPK